MGKRLKRIYEQVVFERRVLLGCTCLVGISVIMWSVSIATDDWFTVDSGQGIYVPETKRYFNYSHSGIWRICRFAFSNTTGSFQGFGPGTAANDTTGQAETQGKITRYKRCKYHEFLPPESKIKADPSLDVNILNFSRTEVAFAIITLLLMVLGFCFSIYTFMNPRYMFKRTAGGLHFLTTGSCLVVIEVLINSIDYEKKYLPFTFPPGSTYHYGYSFTLAWIVFSFNLLAGCAFMLFSRKRKGKKAPNIEIAMADEPTIIGR